MEITWFGHSCFLLRSGDFRLLTDPYDMSLGYPPVRIKQTLKIVTVSHGHKGHNYAQDFKDNPRIILSPGEYETGGIFIYGTRLYHDNEKGAKLGKNLAFLFEMDDLKICHMGDLGHLITAQQEQELGNVDVLILPVGGIATINAEMAAKIVRLLEPKIVIPMHYKTEVTPWLEPVDTFLAEMGAKEAVPQPSLTITKSRLPQETQVVLLERRT